jgi:hypothetical protein
MDMVKPVYPPTTSLRGGITTQADGNLSSSSRKAKTTQHKENLTTQADAKKT